MAGSNTGTPSSKKNKGTTGKPVVPPTLTSIDELGEVLLKEKDDKTC